MNLIWTEFKTYLHEKILSYLWGEWSALGLPGHPDITHSRLIDLEALILFSLNIARYDPRLFDEIVNWSARYGKLINIQRLHNILKKYPFPVRAQLGAIASVVSEHTNAPLKWSKLIRESQSKGVTPLFFFPDSEPVPFMGSPDPHFKQFGFIRAPITFRKGTKEIPQTPKTIVVRLRALLGVNSRCEILPVLATRREIHPNHLADITSFFNKSIQSTLSDMLNSGWVSFRTSGRKKLYRPSSNAIETLLFPDGVHACWKYLPPLYFALNEIWEKIHAFTPKSDSPLLWASEFQLLHDRISPLIELYEPKKTNFFPITCPPKTYLEHFIKQVRHFLDTEL